MVTQNKKGAKYIYINKVDIRLLFKTKPGRIFMKATLFL